MDHVREEISDLDSPVVLLGNCGRGLDDSRFPAKIGKAGVNALTVYGI
jgi:hypothetical protein